MQHTFKTTDQAAFVLQHSISKQQKVGSQLQFTAFFLYSEIFAICLLFKIYICNIITAAIVALYLNQNLQFVLYTKRISFFDLTENITVLCLHYCLSYSTTANIHNRRSHVDRTKSRHTLTNEYLSAAETEYASYIVGSSRTRRGSLV